MSLVRGDVHTKGPGAEGPAVLRDILLSEMANEHAGAQSEGAQAGDVCKDPCEAHGVAGVELPDSSEGVGTDTQLESHVGPDCQGENLPHIESHEAQSFRAWGQWDWADGAAGIHDGCAWRRLDSGICFVTGPTASELSDTLQDGLGESRAQNRHRTGWELALREKSTGREEGRQAGFIRLDGIEILEPGHPELERCRDADGKLYFYDLGATRHPSFSVNGLLVHNSSIIKHHTSKTLQQLLDAFERTPFKLCATATPAPNDWTELGTHAQFLGYRTQSEMLAEFFVHDGGDTGNWRLKGHAKGLFWKWVASWGALLRSPADLGHDAAAYALPPLDVTQHTVEAGSAPMEGMLFALEASSLMERRDARRASLDARVKACAELVNAQPDEPWLIWCDLNAEADALREAIPDAVEVRGNDDDDVKEQRLMDFAHGKIRVLISKPRIAGWGMNFQICARMAFVGVTDSFEAYYQAVRRCWRFGQKRPVHVHIFASEQEGSVVANLARKEADAKAMAESLSAETLEAVRESVLGFSRETNDYAPSVPMAIPSFLRKTA